MRTYFIVTVFLGSLVPGMSSAQDVVPRALYNPATGAIYFDKLDQLFDAGNGDLFLRSVDGNIFETHLLGGNATALAIAALGPTAPVAFNERHVYWNLGGLFGAPPDLPVFAGNIVIPGTDYTDLFFQSRANLTTLGFGNVVVIPEPSTGMLLGIACAALPMCLRRWKRGR